MKKLFVNLILILGLLAVSCAYYNTFYNAEQFFKKAKKEREKRILNQKKTSTTKRRTDPTKPSGAEKQNYDKAIEKASKVLQLYPESKYIDDALMLLGQCFYYQSENLKAVRKFKELLENYPNSEFIPETKLWLARSYLQMKNYEEAEASFNAIVTSRAPREIRDEALLAMGELYFVKKDYVTAAHEYRIATKNIGNKTNRSRAGFKMGECYLHLKDYEKAIEAYKIALKYCTEIESENEIIFQLAKSHKQLKQYDEAMGYLEKLLASEMYRDEWPIVKIEMANCIYQKDKLTQKLEWNEVTLEEQQNRKKADYYLAVEWYEAVIEDHPRTDGSAQAYYYLAEIYKNDYAQYDSAYANYMRVKEQNSRSIMVDSATAKTDDIIELMGLIEVVKQREFALLNQGKNYNSELDLDLENIDETTLDDSTRFKLRKARSLRRLRKWLFAQIEITALPDTLIADSLFADSLAMIDSLWVRDEDGQLIERTIYDEDKSEEDFEEDLTDEERRMRKKKETLARKLAPKMKQLEKNELIQNKILLAENYLFNFNQPDSALTHYHEIFTTFPDSVVTKMKPQILYTMHHIYQNRKQQKVADSLMKVLAVEFPRTPQGVAARTLLQLPQLEKEENFALKLFYRAENEYLENNNIENAIDLYRTIESTYPESDLSAKSLYAAAWLNDNVLNENEEALRLYKELVEKYKETSHAKLAAKKIQGYDKEVERRLAEAKKDSIKAATPDSLLAAADSLGSDSLAVGDSTQIALNAKNALNDSTLKQAASDKSEDFLYENDGITLRTEPRRPSMLLYARKRK